MFVSKKMMLITSASSGIPFAEFATLMHIFRLSQNGDAIDGVRVMKIKEHSHVSLPAVSQQLRSLEEKGLVKRNTTTEDRRVTLVSLTPAGQKMVDHVRTVTDAVIDELVQNVGEANIREYIRLSNEIMKSLEESHGLTDCKC
jgi:DNA-binding MarR family transcriptional regulator